MSRKPKTYYGIICGVYSAKVAAASMEAAADALTKATGLTHKRHEFATYWARGNDCPDAMAEPGRVFVNVNGINYPYDWGTYAEAAQAAKARREARRQ